jgi:hypothetical protein
MEAARRVILRIDADIDALPPISPAELAAGFPSPELRHQFVNGMLVTALADGVPAPETVAKVEEFAEALGISTPEVTDLRRLTEGHMLVFKLDFLRRSQVGEIMRNQLDQHGVLGLAKGVLGLPRADGRHGAGGPLSRLGGSARGHAGPHPAALLSA